MRVLAVVLLTGFLLQSSLEEKPADRQKESTNLNSQQNPSQTEPHNSNTDPKPPVPNPFDEHFLSEQCLRQKYTHLSCAKVFCPPWRRCISGQCVCKIPYKCPRVGKNACAMDGSSYLSICHARASSCRNNEPTFSHFSNTCTEDDMFVVTAKDSGDHKVLQVVTPQAQVLVCGQDWDAAAADVACKSVTATRMLRGAASTVAHGSLSGAWPDRCVHARCTGSEHSLAECELFRPRPVNNNDTVATLTCTKEPQGECKADQFRCVNGRCVSLNVTCDGVNHCGDHSDEMCCTDCRGEAFHCKSQVCIPQHAVKDGIRDCLGGDDEQKDLKVSDPSVKSEEEFMSDPKSEIKEIRKVMEEQLQCGIPNMEYVYRSKDEDATGKRVKRLVGGEEALPTQIQWQVAVQEDGSIHCGGAYLGGCWVLTAAHCVRPKPKAFRIKFSLWLKHRKQSTTDSIPVKEIIIHEKYNPQTYENDIALVKLEAMSLTDECMEENPAVRSVCVPWSTLQFQPNDTCTISGWGRNREGASSATLKWANVTIIGDCRSYYKNRFFEGMECAGDLAGKVDSCQGDSGGPLVCKDATGVSYVWGIVSWGDKCGEPNHPGVYTKVAHYFEWIRYHTSWSTVTKFNV